MARRWVIMGILAVTVVSFIASACDSDDPAGQAASASGSTIGVRDYEFEPGTVTVGVGDTVTWVWDARAPHNVVGEGFRSADQSSGVFRHTFEQPGSYPYGCTIHPGMNGSVVVQERSP